MNTYYLNVETSMSKFNLSPLEAERDFKKACFYRLVNTGLKHFRSLGSNWDVKNECAQKYDSAKLVSGREPRESRDRGFNTSVLFNWLSW